MKKSKVDQMIDNLKFCIETIGLNDEQTGEVLAATNELGVNVEYFCNEFMETSSKDCLLYTSPSPRDP